MYNYDGNSVEGKPQRSQTPQAKSSKSAFLYGICVCCSDNDSCLESYFCSRCQMSRQCNMMKNGEPEIDWLYCMGSFLLDYLVTGGIVGTIFVCQVRDMMRRRYGIAGGPCGDCCNACWCSCCVLQQQLLEMANRGEFPGACCYEAPTSPGSEEMQ